MKFSELSLHPDIQAAIDEAGFTTCTPVQEQTFEHTLIGSDVAVQSQTGTGKTAAFLISIFQLFIEQRELDDHTALVVAPTRELADQIEKDARLLAKHTGLPIGSFYGGVGYHKQERLLQEGVRLAIGTPGRLLDFAESGKLQLGQVGILVIDEADRLFDMGFIPDLRRLIRRMPSREQRVTMLFSATLAPRVKALAAEYMRSPAEITIEPEQVTVELITHQLYHVAREKKLALLLGLLRREQPKNAVIFTNTKQAAYEVATRLGWNDFHCEYIIGDLPQSRRQRLIDQLKAGELHYLVATDVAARGLHVEDLELVVNYDVPEYAENYVHRVGRTARVGKSGLAVTLACDEYVFGLDAIEDYVGFKLPASQAPADLFAEDTSAGRRLGHYSNAREGSRPDDFGRGRGSGPRRDGGGRGGPPRSREGASSRRPQESRPTGPPSERSREAAAARERGGGGQGSGRRRRGGSSPPASGGGNAGRGRDGAPDRNRTPRRDTPPRAARQSTGGGARADAGGRGPSRDMSLDDRLARYRDKYGEEFDGSAVAKGGSGGSRRRRGNTAPGARPVERPTSARAGDSGRAKADDSGRAKADDAEERKRGLRGILRRRRRSK